MTLYNYRFNGVVKIYRDLRGGRWMGAEEVKGDFMEEMERNKGG